MILTNCAACAAPLAHNAPRCVRCHTRYCDATCQHDHWRRGHKQMCKKIHRGGNAEQYYADKKYKEAVAVAVEACADDTKGQKCYICLEAVHSRTGEGLVRGCACGDRDGVSSPELGVAHVSCLARQAKELVEEGEENKLDGKVMIERWGRWNTCSLCEQGYHGVVYCALGWACWKTYVGRPEGNSARCYAITELGHGLKAADRYGEALAVYEVDLATMQRYGVREEDQLVDHTAIADCYQSLGRRDKLLSTRRYIYARMVSLNGADDEDTILDGSRLSEALLLAGHYREARSFLAQLTRVARRVLGSEHSRTLDLRLTYAISLYVDDSSRVDEALAILEDIHPTARRVFGHAHPVTMRIQNALSEARESQPDGAADAAR